MRRFQEWQQTQSYLNHVSHLSKIRVRKAQPAATTRTTKSKSMKRSITEPKDSQADRSKISTDFLPLNLLPKSIRSVFSSTLKQQPMRLKEKEIMLQNFLIGRRIVNTLPVISKRSQDKEYNLYRKASRNMNRSNNSRQLSARSSKFEIYKSICEVQSKIGNGNNLLTLKIRKIALVKRGQIEQEGNQLRLRLRLGKKILSTKMINAEKFLNQEMVFAFKKREIDQECSCRLDLIKNNELVELGDFKVHLLEPINQSRKLDRVKIVEPLMKKGQVKGTVEFNMSLATKID